MSRRPSLVPEKSKLSVVPTDMETARDRMRLIKCKVVEPVAVKGKPAPKERHASQETAMRIRAANLIWAEPESALS